MRFKDVIGQEELKERLAESVAAGRVSHAQLFTGMPGAGALPLAVAYAQYLNCRHRHDGDSCGECPDCRQIADLAHPDLHLVGFDGLCECVAGLKQISTIKIDFPEFAEKTYEVIKKRLEQPSAPMQQIVLKVTLHQRRKD